MNSFSKKILGLVVVLFLPFPHSLATELTRQEVLLKWMQGEWEFVLGSRNGMRTMEMTYPNHLISYTETFMGLDIQGEGYIGYSPKEAIFYSFAAHSVPGEYALLHGVLDAETDIITYKPKTSGEEPYEVVWQKLNEDKFRSTLYTMTPDGTREKQWAAEFKRVNKAE
ncbi:hypothetical protein PUV54_00625 [Hyphococcus flavus]|uniref:DUF1579 domain-containing protein n=1 Tax=Hyphococcus flavus TaxID=1866326 RepID=A0AAF0CEQ6_9PROT|nr:hypothetical protein [Hyphococcus flavus]WDI31691.1 hypothetical protein PUV54_00625 [Hyphococcus flavus]